MCSVYAAAGCVIPAMSTLPAVVDFAPSRRSMVRFRCAAVLGLGVVLCGPTCLVGVQFSPTTAEWHVRSTDHFEIYYTHTPDLNSIGREAEQAYKRVSHDMQRQVSGKVPIILLPTTHDLPQNDREAVVIVRATGAPNRDHIMLPIEPRSGRVKMLTQALTHVFEFEGHR